ncbi:hypothetical protein VTN77DRAFT_4912 [Rasamsonia byssochlamydoides]|uniref:uncharacterized protein n=1 Tax=Rasamsonia byssochlamydoides TaxID=89139 RepID=UPI00374322FA
MSSNPLPGVNCKTTVRAAGNGMGNGLFAATDIEMGQDLLSIQKPFVAVLDTLRLQDTCSGCFGLKQQQQEQKTPEEAVKLKSCTRCQVVRYCDKSCQSKDWKFAHSLECSIYSKLYPKILPNSVRAVLRIVLRHSNQKYNSDEFETFLKLETHAQEIRARDEEQWNRILLSAKAIREYSGVNVDEEIISPFFAKLDLNSFNLTTPFYERIGLYLHPYAAFMNHSCEYNAVVGFEGDRLFVKPVRRIKKDEQIFISYIDATNPRDIRRKELSDRYFFDCNCSKCMKGKDAHEDTFLKPLLDATAITSAETIARERVRSASTDDDPFNAVKTLKSAIDILNKTSVWPITRQPYVSVRDELIVSLLSAQQFEAAFGQATVRFLRVDPVVYPHEVHPIRLLHVWALAKLGIHISQGEPDREGDSLIRKFEVNLALIIWSLLAWLIDKEGEACTSSTFKSMVRAAYKEVYDEFRNNGLDPTKMTEEANREWAKMEKVADHVLELEGYVAGKESR